MRAADHPYLDHTGSPGWHRDGIPQRRFGPDLCRIHRCGARHHVVVDPVLGVRRLRRHPEQPLVVGLVLTEQRFRGAVTDQHHRPGLGVGTDDPVVGPAQIRPLVFGIAPGPGVAEPQCRQHLQGGLVRARVLDGDLHQQIPWGRLGVVDGDHPVPAVVKDPGVHQLVLRLEPPPPGVLGHQVGIGKFTLRVVVTPAVPRMRRSSVEVPPILLDVFPVIALRTGQTEHPLLEDRIHAVPQGQRQAPVLRFVAEPGHAVLVPAVHPGTGVVVREERPGVAVGAVVLADRSPRAFGDVRPPVPPGGGAGLCRHQPGSLVVGRRRRGLGCSIARCHISPVTDAWSELGFIVFRSGRISYRPFWMKHPARTSAQYPDMNSPPTLRELRRDRVMNSLPAWPSLPER